MKTLGLVGPASCGLPWELWSRGGTLVAGVIAAAEEGLAWACLTGVSVADHRLAGDCAWCPGFASSAGSSSATP